MLSAILDHAIHIFGGFCRLVGLLWPLILITSFLFALASYLASNIIWSVIILLAAPCAVLFWVTRTGPSFRRKADKPPTAFFVGLYMISTYILLVMIFACAFLAAERFEGKIVCTSNRVPIDREQFRDYVYFSVVSGSTLGYGELTPLGLTRLFVGIEVIMFWLFIVVASFRMSTVRSG